MAEEGPALYHRLAPRSEKEQVRSSGELWGKARAPQWGNGLPAVKAYLGPLSAGRSGYTFSTETPPTRYCMFLGMRGAEWREGSPGVEPLASGSDYVKITVKVVG